MTVAGHLAEPDGAPWLGLLVLGGSSGRVLRERADVLAMHGIAALAVPWFGGEAQPSTPRRVALDTLVPHLDRLAGLAPRVGVMGTSFGAEAALLLAVRDHRVALVVGQAPTAYVWQTPDLTPDGRPIDDPKWTWHGRPVPGVPYVAQNPDRDWPDARTVHEASLAACPDAVRFAIPVRDLDADVLLTSGGDDRVWQAADFAERIVTERRGLPTERLHLAEAGHQVVLPGEPAAPLRPGFARGGSLDADASLGRMLLAALLARR